MRISTKILVGLVAAAILAIIGAFLFVSLGIYNIAATEQHTRAVYSLVEEVMKYSVRRRAANINVPQLANSALVDNGFCLYRKHCVSCHGGPGVAPDDFAKGMTPVPINLVEVARLWTPAELYWGTKYGIKMTGMPAWEYRLTDEELWGIVAFLQYIPNLSPQQYHDMERAAAGDHSFCAEKHSQRSASQAAVGDPERGIVAIRQYACHSCHIIPGVVGADKMVGPSLGGIASRMYIAGTLPNTPENMLRWIQHPQKVDPLTAMASMGVTDADARDIAAYLYTLK